MMLSEGQIRANQNFEAGEERRLSSQLVTYLMNPMPNTTTPQMY